jgi:hypothetical protein
VRFDGLIFAVGLAKFSPGIYLLKCNGPGIDKTAKFVKQ